MVPRFQINKRPSILNTNDLNVDNDIDVIINEVYDKTEEEENRKSISFLEKVKKLQTSKKSGASSSAGVTVKYQSYGSKSHVTQSPYKIKVEKRKQKEQILGQTWLKLKTVLTPFQSQFYSTSPRVSIITSTPSPVHISTNKYNYSVIQVQMSIFGCGVDGSHCILVTAPVS